MAQSDETFKGIVLASTIAVKIAPDVFPSRYRQHLKILPDSTHLPLVRGSLSRPDPVQVSVKLLLGRSNYARIVNSRPSSAASSWHVKGLWSLSVNHSSPQFPCGRRQELSPFVYMGGRPQAASLVQGLRPRNAPLQNHASPTGCLHRSLPAC